MPTISNPKVTYNIIGGTPTPPNAPQRALYIGQKTVSGTAVSGELQIQVGNSGQESTLFGENSMLANGIRVFKSFNKLTAVDVIALDDNAGGVAASWSFDLTGTSATEDGVLTFTVASKRLHTYVFQVAVETGDTPTIIGDALEALIAANTQIPFTASNLAGVVTVTCVHKGTYGNDALIRIEGAVAGITTATTAVASGAIDPVLTGVLDVIGDVRYQTVVWHAGYDKTVIGTFLEGRFNPTNAVLDGVAIMMETGTLAGLKGIGAALNNRNIVLLQNAIVNKSQYKGGAIQEMNYDTASYFAAVRALKFTDGESFQQYIIATDGARDSFGGVHMASFPYFNIPFSSLPVMDQDVGFTREEIDELKNEAGVSSLANNIVNSSIIAGQIVTTYRTDPAGNPDVTFTFLEYLDTYSNVREYYFNQTRATLGQTRLTDGDLIPNHTDYNSKKIRSMLEGFYSTLSGEGFVLVQAGEAALQFYKENLDVQTDLSIGRATAFMKVKIVTQLREVIGTIQFPFSTNQ